MIKPNELKKFTLSFKTVSPVSLSPRESYCFYKDIDYSGEISEANIIYPFYHYGEYEVFDSSAKYYIPGSAIKGALLASFTEQEKKAFKMYVDDVEVNYENLFLTTPDKLQFIRDLDNFDVNKKPTFDNFFSNVEVQMLKANYTLEVTVYAKDEEVFKDLQKRSLKLAQKKIENAKKAICQLIEKINTRIGKEDDNSDQYLEWLASKKELETFLGTFEEKLNLCGNKNIIFLGGYKGEAFSKSNMDKNEIDNYQGTFYRDEQSGAPFGLVEVLSIKETKKQESTQEGIQ